MRFFLLLIFVLGTVSAFAQKEPASPKRLLGYYTSWSKYNTPSYSAAQIPYDKLTHIAHAFALVSANADGTIEYPAGMAEPYLISQAHASGVKVLLSIGGGDGIQGPRFNKMAALESTRQNFVANVAAVLAKYGYDGVDVDWEVPNFSNRQDCTILMEELRTGLPSPWIISMAVPSDPRFYGTGFDIPALTPIVDFFNVMTYDFYGPWSGATGLVSPLFQDPGDPQQAGSVKASMNLYSGTYGVPVAQMNIGTPFYGYEFDGTDQLWADCSNCADSSPNYAPYIKNRLNQQGWTMNLDLAAFSPYLTNSTTPGFITYDGPDSTAHKVRYVKHRGFGGVFMWELSGDYDGHSQDLLKAMYDVWK